MKSLYDSGSTLSSGFNVEQSSITATNAITSSGGDLIAYTFMGAHGLIILNSWATNNLHVQ